MEPLTTITSPFVVLPLANIDTDQIIPARFLKETTKKGLGKHLFADWRYTESGTLKNDFILNTPLGQKSKILVAGHNFGCGSSREHAPWALVDFGIRAVISTEIADIFYNNALKNGLLPLVVSPELHAQLLNLANNTPDGQLTPNLSIDLQKCSLTLPDKTEFIFKIDKFARYLLLNGLDELDFLLQKSELISTYEQQLSA